MSGHELERVRTAFHEAGHATVALVLGRRVAGVSIDAGLTGAAMCAHTDGDGSIEALRADLQIAVAGREGAERVGSWTPSPNLLAPVDEDELIYGSHVELRLADRAAAVAAERPQVVEGGAPRIATDDEAAADLARQINSEDPDSEINLARELAGRTLDVESSLHRSLAEALLAWRSLDAGEIQAIINTEQE